MHIERGWMDGDHGPAEHIQAVLVADVASESIPCAAGPGPVADTNEPLRNRSEARGVRR